MNKRRLNKRQRKRITDRQQSDENRTAIPGLVIAHYGKEVDIAPLEKHDRVNLQQVCRCHFRANLPTLVCGDIVLFNAANENSPLGVVESIQPRKSLLQRPRPFQPPKPVASNIDTIILVASINPAPIASLIDRYLIAAENAGLEIILLFNKYDIFQKNDTPDKYKKEIDTLVKLYQELGYSCYYSSSDTNSLINCNDPSKVEPLSNLFTDRKSILVGQSGVGKSSIINAITHSNTALIGEVSNATVKGKHTTTTAAIYFLNSGDTLPLESSVIDSPGIREFGLWHLQKDQIIDGMPELRALVSQCKFRDCDHQQSHGCAIQKAITEGGIHSSRLSSYRQILDSLQDQN